MDDDNISNPAIVRDIANVVPCECTETHCVIRRKIKDETLCSTSSVSCSICDILQFSSSYFSVGFFFRILLFGSEISALSRRYRLTLVCLL